MLATWHVPTVPSSRTCGPAAGWNQGKTTVLHHPWTHTASSGVLHGGKEVQEAAVLKRIYSTENSASCYQLLNHYSVAPSFN